MNSSTSGGGRASSDPLPATRQFVNADGVDTLYWGEAIEVLANEIADESVDLIFADPPYNIGKNFNGAIDKWPSDEDYSTWCHAWIDLCIRKLSPRGSLYLMSSTQCMPYLDLHVRTKLHVLSRIVWHYDSSGVQAKKYFGSLYEPILFAVKNKKDYTFNADAIKVEARTGAKRKLIDYRKAEPTVYSSHKVPGNAWYFPRVRYRMPEYEEHPTQKPEALLERVILASTNPGQTVLDPFSGTFTTSAVAQRLGRRSIGIELQLPFVKIGLRRLGIQTELDGERLSAPEKSFKRKTGVASQEEQTKTPNMFDS